MRKRHEIVATARTLKSIFNAPSTTDTERENAKDKFLRLCHKYDLTEEEIESKKAPDKIVNRYRFHVPHKHKTDFEAVVYLVTGYLGNTFVLSSWDYVIVNCTEEQCIAIRDKFNQYLKILEERRQRRPWNRFIKYLQSIHDNGI